MEAIEFSDDEQTSAFDEAAFLLDEEIDEDELMQAADEAESTSHPKKRKKKALVTCYVCDRGYATVEGYKKHLLWHIFADMFVSGANYEGVKAHCREASRSILSSCITCPYLKQGMSTKIKEVAQSLLNIPEDQLWKFVDVVSKLIWNCLPDPNSKLVRGFHHDYRNALNQDLVCDSEVTSKLRKLLMDILSVSDEETKVYKFLIGHFLMAMGDKLEAFFLRSIREPREIMLYSDRVCAEESRDSAQDPQVQNSVYYIGGSTVRSVMRRGLKAELNPEWQNIVLCLKDRFIAGSEDKPLPEVTAWTESLDRGGLNLISMSAWSFLMGLSQVLLKLERPDGSLLHAEVCEHVKNDEVMYKMWNDLVGEKLSQSERNLLLENLCKSFTNTWGKGMVLRRTNAMVGKSRDKIALRASLL